MGRSKFPGKPSKHILRKRVNVLPPTGEISKVEFSGSVTVESVVENKQDEEVNESDSESAPIDNIVNTKDSIKRRLTRKINSSLRNKNATKRSLLSRMCTRTSIKPKINKGVRKGLTRKTIHGYSSNCRSKTTKETTNLVGKFVLPTRSVHSSRVIKPNKRFISDINESVTLKKKVNIAKRHCLKQDDDKSKIKSKCIESGCFDNNQAESDKTTFTNGHKVVLRQARLKLPNQIGTQGPFSTKSNVSPPGTVTCGVCGAVRFYRFVKQARKFNIYSCESCRKFIAKMIKRQACGGNSHTSLVCNKGQGTCHVPPIVRSQQWKLTKCAYRARCPACWLKLCLRAFHMPASLKQSLTLLLPKNMQGLDVVFNNTLPPLLWQANVESKLLEKPQETTTLKQRPVRFRNPKAQSVPVSLVPTSDIKRQKIDLKGPRVKHVCRSASIVLGQPIAIFSDGEKKCDTQDQTVDVSVDEKPVCDKSGNDVKSSITNKHDSTSESDSNYSDKFTKIQYALSDLSDSYPRKERTYRNATNFQNCTETKILEKKQNLAELENGIAIDFWDISDPDYTYQHGFCIIGSDQFPMLAICFLCGSTGRESMCYCSVCCEPYHQFCLEQAQSLPMINSRQCTWMCPRCTKCNECNEDGRQKVNCQKCLKAYHPECLNTKWVLENNSVVCSQCLKCKKCGSNMEELIGNMLLCTSCFKLRKKQNVCPICHCNDENESSMMMECAKCSKLIHAKCEKLSNNQYQILKRLPDAIEYVCSCCSGESSPYWRRAINRELRTHLNRILRLLGKNKTARNLLKFSPICSYSANKFVTNSRKLQFSDNDIDFDNNNYSKDVDVNKIYSFEENEKYEATLAKASNSLSLLDIKHKLNSNKYNCIEQFSKEFEETLKSLKSEVLLKIYKNIFKEVLPWYDLSKTNEEDIMTPSITNEESQNCFLNDEILPPTNDTRVCGFCKGIGDGLDSRISRLLYCGQNEWVHANCAYWSSEVYEEIDGSLQNVQTALSRGRSVRCSHCKLKGATIGCCYKGCYENYHFDCARKAKANFMYDKTLYCSSHELTKKSNLITNDRYFEIDRSVFVELDPKKKKYSDIDKVSFMIGSLHVKNLGKIDPVISDSIEAIIPVGFVCSRLYWSILEPWKLVPYTITTSVQSCSNGLLNVNKNFTIDHTLEKSTVSKILKELNAWQKDIDKRTSEDESESDEEQQNGADILSPELTDAILEELPHDLLDGISVQDIFPKFSYDDLIENLTESFKKSDMEEEIDPELKSNRELKRSKSDITNSKIEELSKSRPSQRSCSLTLSCKLDGSLSPAIKKRKMSATRDNSVIYQLLQVDGNFDDSSSSECGSPTGMHETDPWGNYVLEEPVTCEKCQSTYRTQTSYKRHLENCELFCTSESDSEVIQEQDTSSSFLNSNINNEENQSMVDVNEPVMISSYESYQSEIHTSVLNTQSFVSSKSTAEVINVPQTPELLIQNVPETIEQKSLLQTLPVNTVTPITIDTANGDQTYTINQPTLTITDPSMSLPTNQSQFCVNQSVPFCVNQPLTLQQNTIQVNPSTNYAGNQILSINSNGPITLNSLNQQPNSITINHINQPTAIQQPVEFHQAPSVTIQSVPYNNTILNVGSQNQFSLNGKLISNPVIQTINGTQWVKQVSKPPLFTQKIKSRGRNRTVVTKRLNQFEDGDTIILPAPSSTGQVIVQQLPSTNYVPTFVDAFQQSGQNVQYVTTITPQVNSVPTQSLLQIQPDNNIISIVPGLPQAMYIQQPRVLENQLVVDSNGTLGWTQQQTVQPVYYGFETIVQNTVMQSQQFLPTTMPGVLTANSSYSTTTQVFQTSKLEPVLDVSSNSFVLVNSGQLVNSQPLVNTTSIVNPQQIVTSQPVVQSQAMVNPQSIVDPQPIVNNQSFVNAQPISQAMVNPQSMINTQQVVNSSQVVNSQHMLNSQQLLNAQQMINSQEMVNAQQMVNSQVVNSQQLVNSHQVVSHPAINSRPIVSSQHVTNNVTFTPSQSVAKLAEVQQHSQLRSVNVETKPQSRIEIKPSQASKPSQPQNIKYIQQAASYKPLASHKPVAPSIATTNSITLPTAPFVLEQGIPTNIVTPIPKPPTFQTRPMSRVLPMPTNNPIKDINKSKLEDEKLLTLEETKKCMQIIKMAATKPPTLKQPQTQVLRVETKTFNPTPCRIDKIVPQVNTFKITKDEREENIKKIEIEKVTLPKLEKEHLPKLEKEHLPKLEKELPKLETERVVNKEMQLIEKVIPVEISIPEEPKIDTSLKMIFQKQGQDGTYKVSNNFMSKLPIQVAPLKPIKSVNPSGAQPTVEKQEKEQEKIEKFNFEIPKSQNGKKESENPSSIVYTIETQDGFKYSSASVPDLWKKVLDTVQTARAAHKMPPLPKNASAIINSNQILGLKSNGLKYLIEQLPGATKCSKYKPLYKFLPHSSEVNFDTTQDHSCGAIRCTSYEKNNSEPYDMFGWLSSKHRQPEQISLDTLELLPRRVVSLPMAMKFRQLKLTSKYSVGVYRSNIHGRGLFCLRDIEAGEMVIEYAGEVIRSILTDKREKYYNSKSIGCYMFRVDDNFVVDATMKGNAARFINHSCDPNCYSKVVEILGHKHIIIFALRRIVSGEELTYDYKFPFEDDKIPCTCGSRKCRKFLN